MKHILIRQQGGNGLSGADRTASPRREFIVKGPFTVPIKRAGRFKDLKRIDKAALPNWWANLGRGNLAGARGVYVFGLRRGGGIKPIYVGMTAGTFKNECFNGSNLHKLDGAILDEIGTLVLFLVRYPDHSGRVNKKLIEKLSQFIGMAFNKNPLLLNQRGTKEEERMPVVRGVLKSGQGKPSFGAKALKKMMGA